MTMQLNMYCEHIQCMYCKNFYLMLQFLVLHNRAHRCHYSGCLLAVLFWLRIRDNFPVLLFIQENSLLSVGGL